MNTGSEDESNLQLVKVGLITLQLCAYNRNLFEFVRNLGGNGSYSGFGVSEFTHSYR